MVGYVFTVYTLIRGRPLSTQPYSDNTSANVSNCRKSDELQRTSLEALKSVVAAE